MNVIGKRPAGKATGKLCSWIVLGETTPGEDSLGQDHVRLSRASLTKSKWRSELQKVID